MDYDIQGTCLYSKVLWKYLGTLCNEADTISTSIWCTCKMAPFKYLYQLKDIYYLCFCPKYFNLFLIHILSTVFICEILLTFLHFSTIMFKIESGTPVSCLDVWPDAQIVLRCPWQIQQLDQDDNMELNATGSLPLIIIISLVSQYR